MDTQIKVAEVIGAFAETYRAIDIRTAAIREGDDWANIVAIARLTYEEPGAANEPLRQIEERYGSVKTNQFRIMLNARPFSEWGELCKDSSDGIIRIDGSAVRLRNPLILGDQVAYLHPCNEDIRPFDGQVWPTLQIRHNQYNSPTSYNGALVREITKLGYSHPYEAIDVFLDIDVRQGYSQPCEFYLSVPVFAQIAGVMAQPTRNSVQITVMRHLGLSDLYAIVHVRGKNAGAGQQQKALLQISEFSTSNEHGLIQTVIGAASLPAMRHDDQVEVRLVLPSIGEVDRFQRQFRSLLPLPERNALFEALKQFCPESEIQRLMVRPDEKKPRRSRPSDQFEVRISWLLGLLGFRTLILGEYENIVVPETKVERGTVDILASDPNDKLLLLVSCTLRTPKEEDYGNLLSVRNIFAREVFRDATIHLIPLVFTASTGCPQYKEYENGTEPVGIVDADGLEILLDLLRLGQEEYFVQFLLNPVLCPLQRLAEP